MLLPSERDRRRIGILENDAIMGESLAQRLALEGYQPVWWHTGGEALDALAEAPPDLMICDIRLPDMNGEELFRAAMPALRGCPVLFITAFGEIDQAVRLMRAGANDYLTKPFAMEDFLGRVEHLLRDRTDTAAGGVLGRSEAMQRIEALVHRIANIDSTVLLTGESGVGKEVAARHLHALSRHAGAPFMAVNCAAIPSELIESELFGHERGAFTGAHARHEGYAERARDGILFLDEVTELSLPVQAKLLRLVQERTFFRLGGEQPLQFRARLVCASNADVEARVREGRFREDLFYRINVIPIALPPLRERRDDIRPLLQRYVDYFAEAMGKPVRGLTPQAEAEAEAHDWPGNVRELRNRIERAVALADGAWIGAEDLFPEQATSGHFSASGASLAAVRDAAERRHILATLEATAGQVQQAAQRLGISRTTLWEKMRRLGISGDPRD
ncbi:MAG: sigma-54-dependent transcriptional regulator [Pseudomonadota bacterium]